MTELEKKKNHDQSERASNVLPAMFVKTEREAERDGTADHYPRLAVLPGRQLYRDGLAVIMPPEIERTVPARTSGTWHWAHTAISKGHYPAHRPGGLILG